MKGGEEDVPWSRYYPRVRTKDTEGLKGGQNGENGRPAVVEREREVNKELVGDGAGRVMLLDDVVDLRNSRASEDGEAESCVVGWWTRRTEQKRASFLGYSTEEMG